MWGTLRVTGVVGAILVASAGTTAGDDGARPLLVGDPAPRLSGLRWLRGTGPGEWRKGRVYVLDFWATWCAPCLTQMPDHQGLQDRHADRGVQLLGIAIWSDSGPLTPAEALEAHPGLSYPVAEDVEDRAARTFMHRTITHGLPAMMLIDGDGRLAWVGEPGAELEAALQSVLADSFDLAAAREGDRIRRRSQEMFAEIDELRRAGMAERASARVDDVIALDPAANGWAWAMKYEILLVDGADPAAAANAADAFLAGGPGRNAYFNYVFSRRIQHIAKKVALSPPALDLAVTLAARGVGLAEEPDASRFSALAAAHALRGERGEAVHWQRRAVEAAPPQGREALQATLRSYQAGE